ncbi:PREDICTED: SET and MYND domain-containing protein DDB_G0273589-like [Ceratosolen solmsi marchali]|uniref:SET and MYND domain-containing protein DDB_G0273589-like n=1 Tax=Ceratosolen solmsi marchali TaxID=326594 RepID=A0AAJ7DZN0_9HYME|nr:PREDICTED: SET and MYND domain-containing protein DDB_G0273589-like [Ceratosolen solmsi marchali]
MHQRIWDSYLCSIALSPNDSEMLATSYGNMSALMFHLSKYQDSKCLSAMGISEKDKIFDEARTWLNKIDDNDKMKVDLIQLVDKAKIVLDKNKVKVERTTSNESHVDFFNENEILKNVKNKKRRKNNLKFKHLINLAVKETESVFNSVDLTYNDEYGWHLTATRDIQPGEIIFVVKPYVVVQNFTKSQNFCNNCLNVIWTGIPCKACPCCMFCSKKCHDEAMEKYHSIECPILQFVVSGDSWLDYHIQASLRAVVMGVKEFGSITNLRDKINEFDSFPDDTEYRNYHTSFISLLGFKNIHVEPEILSDLAAACCKTVICLSKFTSFFNSDRKFDTIENFTENEDIKFIAVLLLKIAVIIFNNGIKVTESGLFCKTYVDSAKCSSVVPCCEKGISMNTLSQFIPHSCDPNAKAMKVNNCKEIYYALLPISEGDLILECYKNTFYECEFTQRQQEISRILNRNCTCLACQENWPALLIDDVIYEI